METFLEPMKVVLKGSIREVRAYFTRKSLLDTRKPPRRRKQIGGSYKK